MKKLLSLFSLLWLVGLLAFLATPIYAQDVEDDISSAETAYNEDLDYWLDENGIALETAETENINEGDTNLNGIDDNVDVMGNIDASINDLIWIWDSEGIEDGDESSSFKVRFRLGEKFFVLDSLSYFLVWTWLVILISFLARLILCHIALWRIFWRAWESKWKSLIPLYNLYIVFKISWLKKRFWWIIIVALLFWTLDSIFPSFGMQGISPEFSAAITTILWYCFPRKFGRWKDASILYSLFFPIWVLVLWFWNYKFLWKSEWTNETIVEN